MSAWGVLQGTSAALTHGPWPCVVFFGGVSGSFAWLDWTTPLLEAEAGSKKNKAYGKMLGSPCAKTDPFR